MDSVSTPISNPFTFITTGDCCWVCSWVKAVNSVEICSWNWSLSGEHCWIKVSSNDKYCNNWVNTCLTITKIVNNPVFANFNLFIVFSIVSLLSWTPKITFIGRPTPGGTDDGIGRFFNILKAISRVVITPPVIPNILVVLSIIFKELFTCFTNLFLRLIKLVNSNGVGHVNLSFKSYNVVFNLSAHLISFFTLFQ